MGLVLIYALTANFKLLRSEVGKGGGSHETPKGTTNAKHGPPDTNR